MENDDGSASPLPGASRKDGSARQGEAFLIARALPILRSIQDRMQRGDGNIPSVWLNELEEIFHDPEMMGVLPGVEDQFEKILVIAAKCGYVRGPKPFHVERTPSGEASTSGEAKP